MNKFSLLLYLLTSLIIFFTYLLATSSSNHLVVKRLISVYDGDTMRVDLEGDLDLFTKNIGIRFARIDAPEIRGRTFQEKSQAIQSRIFLRSKLNNCKQITLRNVERGKYFRLVAEVYCDETNLNDIMLKTGHAKKYY